MSIINLSDKKNEYFVHESAYVDQPCTIGSGTQIWHFSHIMPDVSIGENCKIGQNVFVASGVKIGVCVHVRMNIVASLKLSGLDDYSEYSTF